MVYKISESLARVSGRRLSGREVMAVLVLGTIVAMVPGYIMRFKESVYYFFYNTFMTYPGDLWNFFTNYLGKGLHYPPEYPAGLRFLYEVMGFHAYSDYTLFFTVNTILIAAFAGATTYLLYRIHRKYFGPEAPVRNIWLFWIMAPSFIIYGTINYDLIVVFFIVLAVYLFVSEKYYGAVAALAVGTVVKVFPVFLIPLFLWRSPKGSRLKLALVFIAVIVGLNAPYALMDFHTWIWPYIWQISSNITTGPDQGTYWWIIYPLTGKLTGWISLGIFAGLYLFICWKLKDAPFILLCFAVVILFLLTDRIYSPQYNLYLLPFVALAVHRIDKRYFYLVEIPNILVIIFVFFLKGNPLYLQIIVFVRYAALIGLLVSGYRQARKNNLHLHSSFRVLQ